MTDANTQAEDSGETRYDRGATDFIEATIALSDLGARFATTQNSARPGQEVPPDSMWAPAHTAHQAIGDQVARAAQTVHDRAAALSIDNAREAVEYAEQHGIPIPQRIIERAQATRDA